MKRLAIYLPVSLFMFCNFSFSQIDSLQKQINEQVWKPFIQSFNSIDTDGFMAVHSKDVSRVIQDSKLVYGYDRYYQEHKAGDERTKQSNRKRSLELRFIQRIAGNDKAFEIGYFKTTSLQPNGQARSFYGKFHVLLRKEKGTWKILMDADASEKTDESIFLTGSPLEK